MSTENILHALDVSEKNQEPVSWTPVVLKPGQSAPPLFWSEVSETPQPKPQRPIQEPPIAPTVQKPLQPNASFEEMVAHHQTAIVRAIETVLEQGKTGLEQIAILMIGLGSQRAANLLQFFSESDTALITTAIAQRDTITEQQKKDTFEAFRQRILSGDIILHGGLTFARDMLHHAFGPKQGETLLSRILPEENSGFDLIRQATVDQLLPFVSKEHPQAIALILSQLGTDQAAGVLNRLAPDLQADVVYRIAKMDNISPQIMRDLENSLAQDLRAVMSGQITEIGGPKAVAQILNRTSRNTEKAILDCIDKQDADMAEKVRNQMFVFDDIFNLPERDLHMVIDAIESKDWAIALKSAPDQIFLHFDKERIEKIKHIQKDLGPMRLRQIEEAQLKVVQKVRQLEADGKIAIQRVDADDIVLE